MAFAMIDDMMKTARIFHSPDIDEWMQAVAEDARPRKRRVSAPTAPLDRDGSVGPSRAERRPDRVRRG